MMNKTVSMSAFVFLMLMANVCQSNDALKDTRPPGFLWYNLPKPINKKPPKQSKGTPFKQLSYTKRDEVLHFYTMEALHKARQTQSIDDMQNFLKLQDYWLKESSRFRNLFERAMVKYPEYDFSVTHPASSLGTKWLDEQREGHHHQVIKQLAVDHGVLFFYRGGNSFDAQEIPIIRDFCAQYGLYLIPISVDGILSSELSLSRKDNGQADRLGVRFFPAILLVNPQKKETLPVAYGLTTQDVLEKRLFDVATGFKGEPV
jgi:conjugal transfer pilus assembly protein TraF